MKEVPSETEILIIIIIPHLPKKEEEEGIHFFFLLEKRNLFKVLYMQVPGGWVSDPN